MGSGGGCASEVAVGGTARSAWAASTRGSSSTCTTAGCAAAGTLFRSQLEDFEGLSRVGGVLVAQHRLVGIHALARLAGFHHGGHRLSVRLLRADVHR